MKNFQKKISTFMCIILVSMVFFYGSCPRPVSANTYSYEIGDWSEGWSMMDSIIWEYYWESDTNITFILTGNLSPHQDYGIRIPNNMNVTIKSEEGHTYTIGDLEGGSHFYLEDNSTLTLDNVILKGTFSGGVQVNSNNATLNLINGADIKIY